MTFAFPLLLGALALLPAVWWLLRARPPVPRTQIFPPIALLARLVPERNDAATPPLWLLLLRILAAILLITGLAGPILTGRPVQLPGSGTLLVVMDDDVMAAADWPERMTALHALFDAAARSNRQIVLLPTAPRGGEEGQAVLQPISASRANDVVSALRPAPWLADRARAAEALRALAHRNPDIRTAVYFGTGVATTPAADLAFATALRAFGSVQEIRFPSASPMSLVPAHTVPALPPDSSGTDALVVAHLVALPESLPRLLHVRAHGQDGGTLALSDITLPAGARDVPVSLGLPAAMRNRIDTLTLDGQPSAAATFLLGEGDRLRPVGLIATGSSDTPLVGTRFYLHRALVSTTDLHEGSVATLLSQPLSVLIAPDGALADADTRKKVADWVARGGTLIRFAGRNLVGQDAGVTDPAEEGEKALPAEEVRKRTLLPLPLMPTARQLGGTMSWGKPQKLADFADSSPFHGLKVPQDVTVSRQVLARPAADLAEHSWARLADGTPLVTHAPLGKGEIVLFHVTPTADWSNLPLAGLFVGMLDRLVEHATGVDAPADDAVLPPVLTLDGDGALGTPPPFARGLAADHFGTTAPSPEHPPGLYGSRASRRALNVGDTLTRIDSVSPVGTLTDPAGHSPDRIMGPPLLVLALLLLLVDAALTARARGFSLAGGSSLASRRSPSRRATFYGLALLGGLLASLGAQDALAQQPSPESNVPAAALETRLAYVLTGDPEVDAVSREGLQGLSDYVNARTSAVLGHPDGVTPGKDDLAYYPLLYWPVTPAAHGSAAQTAALSAFMAHGGMLVIDTQGVDAATSDDNADGTGSAPGSATALRRATAGLPVPPLAKLDDRHVLTHTFYLLHEFPGRYAGQPVWVARDGEAENDDVSPVIIGAADWAHAWAVDENGDTRFAVIPGGDDQRRLAYRFGVNLVMYALTGNYKADQVHVPAILKRLGQ